MTPVTRASLSDILDSCQFIRTTCDGHSFDDYQNDRLLRRAIEREFEIGGIISGHLPALMAEVASALAR